LDKICNDIYVGVLMLECG